MTCETRYINEEDVYRGKGFIELTGHRPIFGKYIYSGKSGFCNIKVLESSECEAQDHPLNKKYWNNKGCVFLTLYTLEKGMTIYETYPTFPELTNKLVLRGLKNTEFCLEDIV